MSDTPTKHAHGLSDVETELRRMVPHLTAMAPQAAKVIDLAADIVARSGTLERELAVAEAERNEMRLALKGAENHINRLEAAVEHRDSKLEAVTNERDEARRLAEAWRDYCDANVSAPMPDDFPWE